MNKFNLMVVSLCVSTTALTFNATPLQKMGQSIQTLEKRGAPEFSYGLVKFNRLPSVGELNEAEVTSLNFVDENTIYAHVGNYDLLSEIPGFRSFEQLSADYKISEPLAENIAMDLPEEMDVFIYLPSNLPVEEVEHFAAENGIESIPSESLPQYVILAPMTGERISELKYKERVSWIALAPEYARGEERYHFCPGGLTKYGSKGEFARFVTRGPGWDGAGQGCSNLTYFFENGTPDLAGNSEQAEVIRAIRTWEKYVQINFTQATDPNLFDGIDISWELGAHGDAGPFDGAGGVLAHAFYPNPPNSETIAGDLHFDEAETWSVGGGTDLYSVALHEIGHSIGMDHSTTSSAVMFSTYSSGTVYSDLTSDDINGIRTLYGYRSINEDDWDKTFVGNVTGDDKEEIIMVNTSYNGGAIRVDDLTTGDNLLWIPHCNHQGWMDNTDRMFLGDADGNGLKDLILVNTDYLDGAIRAIDLTTGADLSWIMHGVYGNWMDAADKMFVANMNGDSRDELILVNTAYTGGAVRAVNMLTGGTVSQLNHTGTFNGWMDAADRILIGDANGDNEEDLILINTSYTGGAIRAVDISSGTNWGWLNHTGTYNGWMDAADKLAVADMNNDNKDELILVNTSYTGGAIRSINMQTGANFSWIMHGTYGNWMDACDRMFISDVNNDNEEDLVLVNTTYSGGAIRGIDISSGTDLSWLNHGTYVGWMDGADRMFSTDVNADGRSEIVMVNTGYTGGAIRTTTVATGANVSWMMHTGTYNGWMDGISREQNCYYHPIFKANNLNADLAESETRELDYLINASSAIQLEVYPNPASNLVTVTLPSTVENSVLLEVYDLNGRLILGGQQLYTGTNTIDVSTLKNGVYLAKFTDGEQIFHRKIQVVK